VGLTVFDDATNSDRKVWTTAMLSAAAGGILVYLISRDRSPATARYSRRIEPLDHRNLRIQTAPPLGSGAFRAWLEGGMKEAF